jgi:hypothetical protein
MLELLTTEAFAAWFSALDEGPAEDVAATLEVIVQLGTRTEAPGSSDALLWYEHPSVSQRFPKLASFDGSRRWLMQAAPPALVKFTQDWGEFHSYVKRVVAHLQSPKFVARLKNLPPHEAEVVADAVKRIRRLSWARPVGLMDSTAMKRAMRAGAEGEVSARDAAELAKFADVSEVRDAYFAALAAAGFEIADVPPTPDALREISLRRAAPGLRLLYGIDHAKKRGLVVLGEWLDRSFYGDSVRQAEAVWRSFLAGQPVHARPASAR